MSEIDKASVWAVFAQMRLRCLLEYISELENTDRAAASRSSSTSAPKNF
ncbi:MULTISPECIES: hypothetical protein [Actinomycetes]|nr:hypothetical protein [Propionimicrobium lymphophilum]